MGLGVVCAIWFMIYITWDKGGLIKMINLQNYDIAHFRLWEIEKYFTADELFEFLSKIDSYDDYVCFYSDRYTVHQYVDYYHLDDLVKYVHSFNDWLYDEGKK